MERPEDAPLADESGPVPNDVPLDPEDDAAEARPHRSEEQTAEPRPPERDER
jgi:hypothetical protein